MACPRGRCHNVGVDQPTTEALERRATILRRSNRPSSFLVFSWLILLGPIAAIIYSYATWGTPGGGFWMVWIVLLVGVLWALMVTIGEVLTAIDARRELRFIEAELSRRAR